MLLEELAEAGLDGTRKDYIQQMERVPPLIIDDLGMRKVPATAAEDLLDVIMRRYERAGTLLTSNRPIDDWADCSATTPSSPPCSIDSCTTPTSSSAYPGAGAPLQHFLADHRPSSRSAPVPNASQLAGFDPIPTGRI